MKPLIVLDLERSIPILEEDVWSKLMLTKNIERGAPSWAQIANLRASLRQISDVDGQFLRNLLTRQSVQQRSYEFSAQDKQRMGIKGSVRTLDRAVLVEVPSEESEVAEAVQAETARESQKNAGDYCQNWCRNGVSHLGSKVRQTKNIGRASEGHPRQLVGDSST